MEQKEGDFFYYLETECFHTKRKEKRKKSQIMNYFK